MSYAYLMIFFYGVVCTIGAAQAIAGFGRLAGGKDLGYGVRVPEESNREQWKKAHSELAFWGTLVVVLSLPPLIPVASGLGAGGVPELSTVVKIVLTVYGLALIGLIFYPFIKISRLSAE